MNIKYEFVTGEVVEIEVSEEIGEVSIEIDREINNSNRREARRHESYSDDNDKQGVLQDLTVNVEEEAIKSIANEALYKAIKQLQPQQQKLLYKVFFEDRTMADIAREEGVSAKAIQERVKKIKNKLRKIIEKN